MTDLNTSRKPWSLFVIGLWAIAFIYMLCFQQVWMQPGYKAVISWDVFGYYLYLPAGIIYHDLFHLSFLPQLMDKYHPSSYVYAAYPLADGNYYFSYTMGMSILYLPFFLLGHLAAKLSHYPADGLSLPYQLAIYLCGAFYSLMGLLTIRKVLRRFMNDHTVAIALLLLIFATNYFHYSLLENGMQHIYLFFLYSMVLWLTIRWHEEHRLQHMVALGFTMGLMVLMRPTEIIAVLIPALWQVTNISEAKAKLQLFISYWQQLLIAAGCAALMGLPQMLYWKAATSHFIFYSYGNIGFHFLHPYVVEGLVSIRKGWLVYTPIMLFALLGFIPLYRHYRAQFWPVLLFTLVNIYIVFSWSVWWYGGSFGARALVQSYSLLLLPMGAWVAYVNEKKARRSWFYLLAGCFIFLNLFQNWQYRQGMFSTEGMTPYVYKLVFLQTKVNRAMLERYDSREQHMPHAESFTGNLVFGQTIWPDHSVTEPRYDDSSALMVSGQSADRVLYHTPVSQLPLKLSKDTWVKVSMMAYFKDFEWKYSNMAVLGARISHKDGSTFKQVQIKVQHLTANDSIMEPNDLFGRPNTWGRVDLKMRVPANISPTDSLTVNLSNPGGNAIYIDDLKVELMEGPLKFW